MRTSYKTPIVFGLAHGINDFIAGYLLAAHTASGASIEKNTFVFLMYGIIAFGGQLFTGLVVDKTRQLKKAALLSVLLMLCAVGVFNSNLTIAILISGLASAIIHVCGGAACYFDDNESNTMAGIFTSPGVIGLIAGGILGIHPGAYFYALIPLLAGIFYLVSTLNIHYKNEIKQQRFSISFETHDYVMLLLLLAISLRSLMWNMMQLLTHNETEKLIGIAIAAFMGKLFGGYLCDRVSWKKFVYITTFLSAILLTAGKTYQPLFYIGVACLQSGIPITLVLMQNLLRTMPATASGLALGVALVLSGLPMYVNQFRLLQDKTSIFILVLLLFVLGNWIAIRKYANGVKET